MFGFKYSKYSDYNSTISNENKFNKFDLVCTQVSVKVFPGYVCNCPLKLRLTEVFPFIYLFYWFRM